jgi:hypothetical protein
MKAIAFAATALLVTCAAAVAQDKKEQTVECGVDRLDKSWSLTLKSATAKEVSKDTIGDRKFDPPKTFTEIRITLEFAKAPASIKEVRGCFVPESKLPKPGEPTLPQTHIQLYTFDQDNVLLKKFELSAIEGEITGKAGDAFRVVVYCEPEFFKTVKKVELRRSEKK